MAKLTDKAKKADTFGAVREMLEAENDGKTPTGALTQFATLFLTFREAALNIARNGAVVASAKTGAAMENPFLSVRRSTLTELRALSRVKADSVWAALSAELEALPAEAAH